jgi:hypothetical protein
MNPPIQQPHTFPIRTGYVNFGHPSLPIYQNLRYFTLDLRLRIESLYTTIMQEAPGIRFKLVRLDESKEQKLEQWRQGNSFLMLKLRIESIEIPLAASALALRICRHAVGS